MGVGPWLGWLERCLRQKGKASGGQEESSFCEQKEAKNFIRW
jgi:hypothetical protein